MAISNKQLLEAIETIGTFCEEQSTVFCNRFVQMAGIAV